MNPTEIPACPLCGDKRAVIRQVVTQKPAGETDYRVPPAQYHRAICQCPHCQVYFNAHQFIPDNFYAGFYNEASYQGRMLERYQKVRALPLEQSDNKHRAARVDAFLRSQGKQPASAQVLDVGTGLCVFLAEMKDRGYRCFALDPDPAATKHAHDVAQVEIAHTGTLDGYRGGERFDLITFNKVLEHVHEPVKELRLAGRLLRPDGFIYVELPDGDGASESAGFVDRQEFFIEHLTIHNESSLQFLARTAGFDCLEVHTLHEPSGKFSIYGFLRPLQP